MHIFTSQIHFKWLFINNILYVCLYVLSIEKISISPNPISREKILIGAYFNHNLIKI